MPLRPDQQKVQDAVSARLRAGHRRVLIVGETGFGKTHLMASMMRSAASRGMRSIFVTHKRELLTQASATFTGYGIDHGVIAPSFSRQPEHLVQLASVATLAREAGNLPPARLVCFDEAHHVAAPTWSAVDQAFGDAFRVGLTATPLRADGKPLGPYFDCIVQAPPGRWLEQMGFLAPTRHFAPRSTLDVSDVRIARGDYHRGDLGLAVGRSAIDRDALAAYQRLTAGLPALAFASGLDHSERFVALCNAAGIPAEHVDGKTPTTERDGAIARFARAEINILSSVDLFAEGLDLPGIQAVLMLRPTMSLSLYRQMAGRARRPAPGKRYATIIDVVGNWQRHGLANDVRQWSLDPAPSAPQDHSRRLTVCANCDLVAEHRAFCAGCHAPPKPHRSDDVALWRELIAEPGLATRLRSMRWADLMDWADSEQKLRIVALARGYRRGWAWHAHRDRLSGVRHDGDRHA